MYFDKIEMQINNVIWNWSDIIIVMYIQGYLINNYGFDLFVKLR